jgi:hypothetical protein
MILFVFIKGALDGTPCGQNKICMARECVESESVHIPIHSVQKIQQCPLGSFDSEKKYAKTCKNLLNSNDVSLCDNQFYQIVCCQTCLKMKYNKCVDRDIKKMEPLKKSLFQIEFLECTKDWCKIVKNKKICKSIKCENLKKNPCFNDGICKTNKLASKLSANQHISFSCLCKLGYSGNA